MSNFLKRLFGKTLSSPAPTSEPYIPQPFPEDYVQEVQAIIKALKEFRKNEDEATIDLVYDFYVNTIDWIDRHESVDFDSFFNLIVAIKKNMPDWIDGNGFRIHHDIYSEGIPNKEFFTASENEEFLLKLIAFGPDGSHLACILLSEHGDELPQSFIDQILQTVLGQKVLYICDHIQEPPSHWNSSGDVQTNGSALVELVRTHRLTAQQINKVIEYLERNKGISKQDLADCNFYLALCPSTSLKYLTELLSDQTLTWGWVESEQGRDFVEVTISSLAQKSLTDRKALHT
jgi:hypothetical protein